MTAAEDPSARGVFPLATATPSQIRDALAPESRESFEQHWRELLARAGETFDLTEIDEALSAWRMTAAVTASLGVDGFRAMLADAEERLRTGERAPGAVSWDQLKVELGLT